LGLLGISIEIEIQIAIEIVPLIAIDGLILSNPISISISMAPTSGSLR